MQELTGIVVSGNVIPDTSWARTPAFVALRRLVQWPVLASLGMVAPLCVEGLEHLAALNSPAIFAANHCSHLDTALLIKALPPQMRSRLAVAAAADYFFCNPFTGAAVALVLNAFPLCRVGGGLHALDSSVEMLANGWSLLIYPEGTRSVDGQMARFRPGVGVLAVSTSLPVVPVYIRGTHNVLPKGRALPRPGKVEVTFGEPVYFGEGADYRQEACEVEDAVRALSGRAGA